MNIYKDIKEYLKPTEVVKFYLGNGKYKSGSYWYISPFRREKTASFCVSDKKGIHDFGDSKHYDVISFVSKLFDINSYKSAEKLVNDFSLPIDLQNRKPKMFYERDLKKYKERLYKKEIEEKTIKDYYENIYSISCEKFKDWNNFIFYLQKHKEIQTKIDLWRVYVVRDYYEWICDSILNNDPLEIWKCREIWEGMLYGV